MKRVPLRWLILIPVVVSVTLGFAVFAFWADRVEYQRRVADVDAELVRAEIGVTYQGLTPDTAVDSFATVPRTTAAEAGGAPGASDVSRPSGLILNQSGNVVQQQGSPNPFSDATLKSLASATSPRSETVDDQRVRVTLLPSNLVAVTALPLDQVNDATADFRRALLFGGVVIVLLEVVVIWAITSGLIASVTRISGVASKIADGELDTDVGAPTGSRETANLMIDLERMLEQLRSTINEAEDSAARANAARAEMQRFLADASHELRTPLTSIKGYSELYEKGMLEDSEGIDRAMGRIKSESDRLANLVAGMLVIARGDDMPLSIEEVDLGELVANVVLDVCAARPLRSISLSVDSTVDGGFRIQGDSDRLHQAILNLVVNACDHTEDHVPIEVSVRRDERTIRVVVCDHGQGVDLSERENIFVPLYQSDRSRSRKSTSGAGLGLAIARQIVIAHDGQIDVSETPGGGATFTIVLL